MPRDGRADLITDLTYLRKGPGLTLERLRQAGSVVQALGRADQPLETSFERLTAAVRSLRGTPGGLALAAAFGTNGSSHEDLKLRRGAYAAGIGRSPYTVRVLEDRAIEELALRLLSAFYAGAPIDSDLPIPHGGFLMLQLTTTYLIRDRQFVESQQWRTVVSLVDGAAGFAYGTYTSTELSDVEGGRATSRVVRDGSIHEIRFPRRLRRAQEHRFSFRERTEAAAKPTETADEDYAGQTFETPTLRYRVEVCFLGAQPEVVWSYDKVSRIERPGEPTGDNVIRMPGGIVTANFADLYGGLCSGVAWRWPPR